jgi:hypothetical protein
MHVLLSKVLKTNELRILFGCRRWDASRYLLTFDTLATIRLAG